MMIIPKVLPSGSRRQPVMFGNLVHWDRLILRTIIEKNSRYKTIKVLFRKNLWKTSASTTSQMTNSLFSAVDNVSQATLVDTKQHLQRNQNLPRKNIRDHRKKSYVNKMIRQCRRRRNVTEFKEKSEAISLKSARRPNAKQRREAVRGKHNTLLYRRMYEHLKTIRHNRKHLTANSRPKPEETNAKQHVSLDRKSELLENGLNHVNNTTSDEVQEPNLYESSLNTNGETHNVQEDCMIPEQNAEIQDTISDMRDISPSSLEQKDITTFQGIHNTTITDETGTDNSKGAYVKFLPQDSQGSTKLDDLCDNTKKANEINQVQEPVDEEIASSRILQDTSDVPQQEMAFREEDFNLEHQESHEESTEEILIRRTGRDKCEADAPMKVNKEVKASKKSSSSSGGAQRYHEQLLRNKTSM